MWMSVPLVMVQHIQGCAISNEVFGRLLNAIHLFDPELSLNFYLQLLFCLLIP